MPKDVDMRSLTYKLFKGTILHCEANPNLSFKELRDRVATPKGTTEAGLKELEHIDEKFLAVYTKSIARSRELNEQMKKEA